MMKPNMYPLATEIEEAYARAAVVVFETDMQVLESPEFAMKFMSKATYAEGESLQKHLSPAIYSLLASNLHSSAIKVEMLNQFRPWMAAVTLVVVELQDQGFDAQSGLDKHLHTRALADKKTLDHFEAPGFQMDLFTGLTDKESEEFLGQTLRDLGIWKKQFDLLAAAWQTGDTKALDELMLDSMREYPALYKKLMLERNRTWLPKLEKLLRGERDVLVVVGAGHLVGKDSVVDLLSAKGYKIQQR